MSAVFDGYRARSVPPIGRHANGRSRCAPVVVEQSTQALLSMDPTDAGRRPVVDQRIFQTLMIPLVVVMLNELGDRSSEMPPAQRDHPVETLLFDRPHKSLRICIRVRGLIRRLHDPNPRLAEPFAHGRLHFVSRSQIRTPHVSESAIVSVRTIWRMNASSGCGVAPRMRTRRDASSITNTV